MGQPCAKKIAFVVNKNLGLIFESSEGARVHDTIAIALKLAAISGGGLLMAAALACFRFRRVNSKFNHRVCPMLTAQPSMRAD